MKQIIVLIATIVLGVSLSGVVMGMGDGVGDIADSATEILGSEIGYTTTSGISLPSTD